MIFTHIPARYYNFLMALAYSLLMPTDYFPTLETGFIYCSNQLLGG